MHVQLYLSSAVFFFFFVCFFFVCFIFSAFILFREVGAVFTVFHYLVAALPLTSQCCFLVSQLMQCASAGLLFLANTSLLFGSGSREVIAPHPPPPRPPVPSRQARRLLSCLVETAPLRLARSAAVRAQLRLAGTHVARFHL